MSIHGDGIDIEATIRSQTDVNRMLAKLCEQMSPRSPHDFEVVQDVIKHGDLQVLEAIVTITNAEIVRRTQAS